MSKPGTYRPMAYVVKPWDEGAATHAVFTDPGAKEPVFDPGLSFGSDPGYLTLYIKEASQGGWYASLAQACDREPGRPLCQNLVEALHEGLYDLFQVTDVLRNGDTFTCDAVEGARACIFVASEVHVLEVNDLGEYLRGVSQAVSDWHAPAAAGGGMAEVERHIGKPELFESQSQSFITGYLTAAYNGTRHRLGLSYVEHWPH